MYFEFWGEVAEGGVSMVNSKSGPNPLILKPLSDSRHLKAVR